MTSLVVMHLCALLGGRALAGDLSDRGAKQAEHDAALAEAAALALQDVERRARIAEEELRYEAALTAGDLDGATRAAETLFDLDPDDPEARVRRLTMMGISPSGRADAIAGLREFLEEEPTHREARLTLARFLAWSGRSNEAKRWLDALIEEEGDDADALLARAQIARWDGDRARARRLLARAEKVRPRHAPTLAEHARLELDSGRAGASRREAKQALALSPGLYEATEALRAVREATRASARLRGSMSQESAAGSTPFVRQAVAIPVEVYPLPDTRLRVEPVVTHFAEDTGINRASLGLQVRQGGLPQGIYGKGLYRAHQVIDGDLSHEGGLELGAVHPFDLPVQLGVGARQRALVDAPLGYEDVAYLAGVGSGGATIEAVEAGIRTREVYLDASITPFPAMYVYGSGSLGFIDDGNRSRTLAAGLGQDLLVLFGARSRHALVLKYDLYGLSMDRPSELYYSPDPLWVHTPGLDWRFHPRDFLSLGAEAGVPIPGDGRVGYVVGAFVAVEIADALVIEARGRILDDTIYRIDAATVSIGGVF